LTPGVVSWYDGGRTAEPEERVKDYGYKGVLDINLKTLRKAMDAPRKKTERKKNLNKLINTLIKELKEELANNEELKLVFALSRMPVTEAKNFILKGE
jgi:CHAT domain-containing protein